MRSVARRIGTTIIAAGFDPRRLLATLRFVPTFVYQLLKLQSLRARQGTGFKLLIVPTLSDCYMPGGTAKGHYFHMDLWAARRVFEHQPRDHVDVGSRIDGFIAHLLTFRSVKVLDVRPLSSQVSGLHFAQADLMATSLPTTTSDSVSCLHALEHFGLGRYGDPLDLDGWLKGVANLARLVEPGGRLYLAVPISDEQRIEFNAQRVFHPETLVTAGQSCGLDLVEFSFVNDAGDLVERVSPHTAHCSFGCGCYIFSRPVGAPA